MSELPLRREDFQSDQEYLSWCAVMMDLYQKHADKAYQDATDLAARAVYFREDGNSCLARVGAIAKDLARFLDTK